MDFISSLDTVSLSSDLFKPNIFINKFVEAERIFTNGVDILEITLIGLIAIKAISSGFCNAILFGSNSPNTKVI